MSLKAWCFCKEAVHVHTSERLQSPEGPYRLCIRPRMLVKHVLVVQEECVDKRVGLTDNTVYLVGTTIPKNAAKSQKSNYYVCIRVKNNLWFQSGDID